MIKPAKLFLIRHAPVSSRKGFFPEHDPDAVIKNMGKEAKFSRKTWGLLSLELWYQEFHDKFSFYKNLIK